LLYYKVNLHTWTHGAKEFLILCKKKRFFSKQHYKRKCLLTAAMLS
jgi:hypothetical protein